MLFISADKCVPESSRIEFSEPRGESEEAPLLIGSLQESPVELNWEEMFMSQDSHSQHKEGGTRTFLYDANPI